jgi:phage tail sheath gpL-like
MATTNTYIKAEDGWVLIAGPGAFFRATGIPHSGSFQLVQSAATPNVNSTKATGTITLSSTGPANNDTVTIGGQVYTFKTSPSAATDVLIGADNTATSASLVTKINANSTVVTATSALGVTTLTAVATGTAGNAITLTKSGANIAVSGATLTGAVNIDVGITIDCKHGITVNVTYTGNFYAKVNNSLPDKPLRIDVLTF